MNDKQMKELLHRLAHENQQEAMKAYLLLKVQQRRN